jgi:hypothetical protein
LPEAKNFADLAKRCLQKHHDPCVYPLANPLLTFSDVSLGAMSARDYTHRVEAREYFIQRRLSAPDSTRINLENELKKA